MYITRKDLDFGKRELTDKDIKKFYNIDDSKQLKAIIKQLLELGYIYESDKDNTKDGDSK